MTRIAITGATGFIGAHLLERLTASGHQVRCLARPRPGRRLMDHEHVEWISGDAGSMADLDALVEGAGTVIHLAGLTRAIGRDQFHDTNCRATARLTCAARRAGVGTFILVSSLAASRPDVSPYAWSKAMGEEAAAALAGDMALITVRPPAVLGPGDTATRDLIAMLRKGWLVSPGKARQSVFSWIDAGDLSDMIAGLATSPPDAARAVLAPCSGNAGWQDLAEASQAVLRRRIRRVEVPPVMVRTLGALASLAARATRRPLILSRGKAEELLQLDWRTDEIVKRATPLQDTLTRCLLEG